jgi:hypothetical protein
MQPVLGWSSRRRRSKRGGSATPDRQAIREARAALLRPQRAQHEPAVAVPEQKREESSPSRSGALRNPEEMNRADLIEEIRATGQFVSPRSKDETLRNKVREIRNAQDGKVPPQE